MPSAECHLLEPDVFDGTTYSSIAGMDSMVFSAAFASPAVASNAYLAKAVRYDSNCAVKYAAVFS